MEKGLSDRLHSDDVPFDKYRQNRFMVTVSAPEITTQNLSQVVVTTSGTLVRPPEIGILLIVLGLWLGSIKLFINRWGKLVLSPPYVAYFEAPKEERDSVISADRRMSLLLDELSYPRSSIVSLPHSYPRGRCPSLPQGNRRTSVFQLTNTILEARRSSCMSRFGGIGSPRNSQQPMQEIAEVSTPTPLNSRLGSPDNIHTSNLSLKSESRSATRPSTVRPPSCDVRPLMDSFQTNHHHPLARDRFEIANENVKHKEEEETMFQAKQSVLHIDPTVTCSHHCITYGNNHNTVIL